MRILGSRRRMLAAMAAIALAGTLGVTAFAANQAGAAAGPPTGLVPAGTQLMPGDGSAPPKQAVIQQPVPAGSGGGDAAPAMRECTITIFPVQRDGQTITGTGQAACNVRVTNIHLAVVLNQYDGANGPELAFKAGYYDFPNVTSTPTDLPATYECGSGDQPGPYFRTTGYIHVTWDDGTTAGAQAYTDFVDLGSC
jgi:hypothetical protein